MRTFNSRQLPSNPQTIHHLITNTRNVISKSKIRSSIRLFASSGSTSSATFEQEEALQEAKQQLFHGIELYQSNMESVPPNVDSILQDLETEASDPSFWDADKKERNSFVTSQISHYGRLQTRIRQWTEAKDDGQTALEMLQDAGVISDPEERQMFLDELEAAAKVLVEDGEKFQLELLLSGPYDQQPCRLLITAGAGGTESNDWVAMLKRMYQRHVEQLEEGYTITLEDEQAGDVVGYKSVEFVINGPHAYGWFRGEKGAHRLVRLSPFNANNKRQTTFAGVDVAPILMDQDIVDIDIPDKELEITTMRSGGAGGQNVNKVNTAVRIKHLPSGLQVKCTQERSQSANKELAMKRLKGQLLAIAKEQKVQEIQQIRGDQVEASWGAQIRNYVLHPYKMIKDQRSNWETTNAQGFLDGDLSDCIASVLQHRAKEEAEAAKEGSLEQ